MEAEVAQLNINIIARKERIEKISQDKAEIIKILETHGAIEEFSKIQELYLANKQKLEVVKRKITDIKE